MPLLDKPRLSDLHLRVTAAPIVATFLPMRTEMQENLRTDVTALVAEYMVHLNAPPMEPKVWASASIEILSEDTLQYIRALEELLEEMQANPKASRKFFERVSATLR